MHCLGWEYNLWGSRDVDGGKGVGVDFWNDGAKLKRSFINLEVDVENHTPFDGELTNAPRNRICTYIKNQSMFQFLVAGCNPMIHVTMSLWKAVQLLI